MIYMNINHLRYFVDAALEGSVSLSARKNFVTQSAVSRAISALEQELGVELTLHRQNHFQLTEAGEAVLERSRGVFDGIAGMRDAANRYHKTFHGPLRFGCNQAIAGRLIGPALVRLEAKYPGIRPEIEIGNTDHIQRKLDERAVDFGIVVDDGEVGDHYQTRKIYTGKLVIVKSPRFRPADPLRHLIVSRIQKGSLSGKFSREYEKAYGERIAPKLIVSGWQVLLDFALAGYGAALVPHFLCEEALRARKIEVVSHRVKTVTFDLCTIVGRDRVLPKNAAALFDCLALRD
jgi:DNA-binding transcriptional LysR family regulator